MALDFTDRDDFYETLQWLGIDNFWEWIYSLYSNIDFSRLSISEIVSELEIIRDELYWQLKEKGIHHTNWKKLYRDFGRIYRLHWLSWKNRPKNMHNMPKVCINGFNYAINLQVKSKREIDVAISTIILEVSNILE